MLIRNFARNSKFDPFFQCDPLQIIKVEDGGRRLNMKGISNGKLYQRHPDDIKLYNDSSDIPEETENTLMFREEDDATNWQEISHKIIYDEYEDCDNDRNIPIIKNTVTGASFLPRPIRERTQNRRYFNEDMTNN